MELSAAETNQIRNAIISNTFPSKDIKLAGTTFCVSFNPEPTPSSLDKALSYFKPLVTVRGTPGKEFLHLLPVPLFITFFIEYLSFYQELSTKLTEMVPLFVDTPESMNVWEVFKSAGPDYALILDGKRLNPFQHLWVVHNVRRDTQNRYDLIDNIFEAAKPWLSPELYSKVSEHAGASRENYLYDDPELDAKLMREADTILKKKMVDSEDLDIIEIEDSDNG